MPETSSQTIHTQLGLFEVIGKIEEKHIIGNPIRIATVHAFGSQKWSIV